VYYLFKNFYYKQQSIVKQSEISFLVGNSIKFFSKLNIRLLPWAYWTPDDWKDKYSSVSKIVGNMPGRYPISEPVGLVETNLLLIKYPDDFIRLYKSGFENVPSAVSSFEKDLEKEIFDEVEKIKKIIVNNSEAPVKII
jgi:hypothetical protein